MRGWVLAMSCVAVLAPIAAAQRDGAEGPRARPELIHSHERLVPGDRAWLGITFEIEEGWHLYWNGRNDSGMPVAIKLHLPEGYKAADVLWPAPKRHVSPGDLLDHIYEGRITLLVPVEVPADAGIGDEPVFAADLQWMVCSEVCIVESARVERSLVVGESRAGRSEHAPHFRAARHRLPRPLPPGGISRGWRGDTMRIAAEGAHGLAFYPRDESAELVDPIRGAQGRGRSMDLRIEPGDHRPVLGVLEVFGGPLAGVYTLDAARPDGDGGREDPD